MAYFTYAYPCALCGIARDCTAETRPKPLANAGRFKNWAIRESGLARVDEPADSGLGQQISLD
jgi:hypothetical protein